MDESDNTTSKAERSLAGCNNSKVVLMSRPGVATQSLCSIKSKYAPPKAKSLSHGKEQHIDCVSLLNCVGLDVGCQHSHLEM
jgi:hypothetical protein